MNLIFTILLCGILQSVMTIIVLRKKCFFKRALIYYIYVFWLSFNYYVMSMVKLYLGNKWDSLFESFWNMNVLTAVHYSILLLLFAITINAFVVFVQGETIYKFLQIYASSLFFSSFFTFFCVREMSNLGVTVCAFLHIIVMMMTAFICLKKDVTLGEIDKNARIKTLFFTISTWLVLFSVSTPVELYLNNSDDFSLSFWTFFLKLVIVSLCILVLFTFLGSIILVDQHFHPFNVILFGMTFMGYLQGMFLNGKMNQLDGVVQTWDNRKKLLNLVIWISFLGLLFIVHKKKRELLNRIMKYGCIYLALIQIVTIIFSVITSPNTTAKQDYAITTENFCAINKNNNIIVFVLDKFDGMIIDEIVEQDESFLQPLEDFVYFPNATSAHCPTENSIPYLLTGATWSTERSDSYVSYAYDDSSLINCMYESGYNLDIYTDPYFVNKEMVNKIDNFHSDIEKDCNSYKLFSMMNVWARYRFAPFVVKQYYFYYTYEFNTLLFDESIYSINNDYKVYQQLMKEKLYISDEDSEGTFKFIHMKGAHPPYVLSEDLKYTEYDERRKDEMGERVSQAKGSLKIVYEYLRQLRELGQYDNATIIITADHGETDSLIDENDNVIQTSLPIMFVKDPDRELEEKNEVSFAPVCQKDIISLILRKINKTDEKTFFDYDMYEKRLRQMYYESSTEYVKYEIDGNVRDINSWKMVEKGLRVDVAGATP